MALALMVIALCAVALLMHTCRTDTLTRFLAWLRAVNAEITEIEQRRRLLRDPWLEEFLHWGLDGTLHGSKTPAPSARRSSVTATGWCPGMLRRTGLEFRE